MNAPLMPKATAVWLIDNTTLTFDQIADFCKMHTLEIQGIADGDVAGGIAPQSPVMSGELELNEIKRCEQDPSQRLRMTEKALKHAAAANKKKKGSRYTPVARRQDKPDAIAWLLKHCDGITDAQVAKLIGTTKNTIKAIRERTHWNMGNINPRDPVLLGLCSQAELDKVQDKVRKIQEKLEKEMAKNQAGVGGVS
jgi:hypothetical protein